MKEDQVFCIYTHSGFKQPAWQKSVHSLDVYFQSQERKGHHKPRSSSFFKPNAAVQSSELLTGIESDISVGVKLSATSHNHKSPTEIRLSKKDKRHHESLYCKISCKGNITKCWHTALTKCLKDRSIQEQLAIEYIIRVHHNRCTAAFLHTYILQHTYWYSDCTQLITDGHGMWKQLTCLLWLRDWKDWFTAKYIVTEEWKTVVWLVKTCQATVGPNGHHRLLGRGYTHTPVGDTGTWDQKRWNTWTPSYRGLTHVWCTTIYRQK